MSKTEKKLRQQAANLLERARKMSKIDSPEFVSTQEKAIRKLESDASYAAKKDLTSVLLDVRYYSGSWFAIDDRREIVAEGKTRRAALRNFAKLI